jgi:hypothetical protein
MKINSMGENQGGRGEKDIHQPDVTDVPIDFTRCDHAVSPARRRLGFAGSLWLIAFSG